MLKKRRTIAYGLLIVTVYFALFSLTNTSVNSQSVHQWVVDIDGTGDFKTIQQAVNEASSGDYIFVHKGTYEEIITVNKTGLKIVGDNVNTKLQGKFIITASNVFLSGFTINAGPQSEGIYLDNVDNCYISNNTITNASAGINLDQRPSKSDTTYASNSIAKNNLLNNTYGIKSSINYNQAPNSIYADNFLGNQIINNSYGIYLTSNITSASPTTYNGYTISGNNISSCNYAININWNIDNIFLNQQNITLGGNAIKGNYFGSNSFVFETTANINYLNTTGSVDLSLENHVYNNSFVVNGRNNHIAAKINIWDMDVFDGKSCTFFAYNITQINVKTYSGYLWSWDTTYWDNGPTGGNHWSNNLGTDANSDGLADSSFTVSMKNIDRYPLMAIVRLENYPTTPDWVVLPDPTTAPSPTPTASPSPSPSPSPTSNPSANPITTPPNPPTPKPTNNPLDDNATANPTPIIPEFPSVLTFTFLISSAVVVTVVFRSKQTNKH